MIITPKFIFLHFPKTGGTFVREVMYRLPPHPFWYRLYCFLLRPLLWGCIKGLTVFDAFTKRNLFKAYQGYCLPSGEKVSRLFRRDLPLSLFRYRLPAGEKIPTLYYLGSKYYLSLPGFLGWVHGGFHQLPESFLFNEGSQKPILFTIRNPFAQQASMYFYATEEDRKRQPPEEKYLNGKRYCELTFREHLLMFVDDIKVKEFHKLLYPGLEQRHDIGFISFMLIFLVSPSPREIMEMAPSQFAAFFKSGGHQDWFDRFRFIHTENLNQELYQFLLEMTYPEEQIKFILQEKPSNTSESQNKRNWLDLYDDELVRHVCQKNWIFFEMFPEYQPKLESMGSDSVDYLADLPTLKFAPPPLADVPVRHPLIILLICRGHAEGTRLKINEIRFHRDRR